MINQSLPTSSLQAFQMSDNKFQITDEDLILRFQSGDENAYVELVNRYKDKLTNFVFYLLKDEEHSEDIVQDTFIRLYEKKHYYKEIAKFSTWIYTIARNLANTELRKKSRTKIMYLSQMSNHKKDYDLKSSDPELNTNIENEFLMKEIHAAIDKLPENYKSVVILRDIQGLGYEQISNIVGVPLGTVKSRINRARLQLQLDLMDYKKE